jgi:hypothetical protein
LIRYVTVITFIRYVTVIAFIRYVTVITFIRYVTVITFIRYVTVIIFIRYSQYRKIRKPNNLKFLLGKTTIYKAYTYIAISNPCLDQERVIRKMA